MRCVLTLSALLASLAAAALTPGQIAQLTGEAEARDAALNRIVADGDASAIAFLEAFSAGNVQKSASTKRIFILAGDKAVDAVSGKPVDKLPEDAEEVVANNSLRRALGAVLAALNLSSPDRGVRLAAAKTLQDEADDERLPVIERALAREPDAQIKALLARVRANLQLPSKDKNVRVAAITSLGSSVNPNTKTILLEILAKKDGDFVEKDADIRFAANKALIEVEGRLTTGERIGQVFSGVSLGSILLLAALGLAITYGLMGVINMAHGELIMIGAYTTYVVQNLVRGHAPDLFDWYLLAAVPASFMVAAGVGMLLERGVIRFLYGRPLETLLATWGISLILIQSVRTIFGAQNVQVENPVWMSGGVELLSNVVLPYSRIVIIGFSAAVLTLVWLALTRTRLGLFVRGVTQNRAMAACVGVHTGRIDTWCFGLGSGIAGLAGCALSQIGNVGPDLGQSYIVDSFMVVVLGGVGQLAGTVYAAIGLGVVNKFLEGISGAVLAKITVLVFIIIFIQKRPQGMFALKGRFADA
ncbi:MAG: urea ABC transporter permease subunit UrtB [Betaproteobacteria bacterium]|nr:urea ABC transporter permease subunit UrtB [Betaproteobacteria bacterium]